MSIGIIKFTTIGVGFIVQLLKAVIGGTRKIQTLFLVGLILILTAIIITSLVSYGTLTNVFNLIAGILAIIGGLCILSIYAYQSIIEENEEKKELKKVQDRIKENPNEPTAAWELARIKLEVYLKRNLSQIQWIFIWTVLIMIIGFAVLSYGIVKAYEPTTKLEVSIITISSGILVEFIGATFLVIYKSTMQQAKEYVNVLERINAVGMSVQILESISKEESKLQDQTRAELAKQLLELYISKPN